MQRVQLWNPVCRDRLCLGAGVVEFIGVGISGRYELHCVCDHGRAFAVGGGHTNCFEPWGLPTETGMVAQQVDGILQPLAFRFPQIGNRFERGRRVEIDIEAVVDPDQPAAAPGDGTAGRAECRQFQQIGLVVDKAACDVTVKPVDDRIFDRRAVGRSPPVVACVEAKVAALAGGVQVVTTVVQQAVVIDNGASIDEEATRGADGCVGSDAGVGQGTAAAPPDCTVVSFGGIAQYQTVLKEGVVQIRSASFAEQAKGSVGNNFVVVDHPGRSRLTARRHTWGRRCGTAFCIQTPSVSE